MNLLVCKLYLNKSIIYKTTKKILINRMCIIATCITFRLKHLMPVQNPPTCSYLCLDQ